MTDEIPDYITVDGERIDIVLKPRMGDLDDRGHEAGGQYIRSGPRIEVVSFMTLDAIRGTVWHELFHHAFARSGLSLRYKQSTEERVVQGLSEWSLAALKDPTLVSFLTDRG